MNLSLVRAHQSRSLDATAFQLRRSLLSPGNFSRHGKMSANPAAMALTCFWRTSSGRHPTGKVRSLHPGFSCLGLLLSRRRISPAMDRVLKWISKHVSSGQCEDIEKRELTVVRHVLELHTLPSRRVTNEGNAMAKLSTSSSVRQKRQEPLPEK